MPNFTQTKSKSDRGVKILPIKVYGFHRAEHAKKVALLLSVASFVPRIIYTVGSTGRLLCAVDYISDCNIYVRVLEWSHDAPVIEWTTDHTLFSRRLKQQAREALLAHAADKHAPPKVVQITYADIAEMDARMGVLAS